MENRRMTTQLLRNSDYTLAAKTPLGPMLSLIDQEYDVIEGKVLNELLLLDEDYRSFFKEYLKELGLQRMAADKLWPLTRDYSAQSEGACTEPHPRLVDGEDLIINRYQLHYQIILRSNMTLYRGISHIRNNLLSFRREHSKLDPASESSFVLGDAFHKPIKFFVELAEELFNYFHSHYLKLDCGARHLDPSNLDSVASYQTMLAPCEEFEEYLLHNLSYCQCLRTKQTCPELPKPLPKTTDVQDAKRRAQLARCRYRVSKLTRQACADEEAPLADRGYPSLHDTLDLEHELRMNQLTFRLAQLRESNMMHGVNYERQLVQQMIYALSPSLVPATFRQESQPNIGD